MARYFSILALLLLLQEIVNGANILFLFGGGNYSHKMSVWPLVLALTEKGHNITFVSSTLNQPKPNQKVHDLSPTFMQRVTEGIYNVDRIQDRKDGKEVTFTSYESESLKLCRLMMNSRDPEFTNLVENGKFDLVVVNAAYGDCAFFLTHYLGSKYVMFDSSTVYNWMYGMYGLQLETSWIAELLSQVTYPMNFWGRLKNWYYAWYWYQTGADFEDALREMYMQRFNLSHAPSLIELQRNASLVLVNTHYTMDFARALPPIFVNIGGMQSWESVGDLPENFQKFVGSFEEGIILISFGSTIVFNTLSEEYLTMFINMMRKFDKVGFIWRWEGPKLENQPKNLLAEKWLPQREILREPSIRALMSHGGINSVQEATHSGVPIIVMPLFADQDFQAYRIEAQEIGVRVEAATLSQKTLDDAVWRVLKNPRYKKNMLARSRLFQDRPNPTDTAVEAVEFVLRHNDFSALKPMDMDQSFWVRNHVDVYFFIFLAFVGFNLLIPITIILALRKLR